MGFVKVQKTTSYFARYQTKFRRRRAGKTDYRARHRLVCMDKNKYSTPRYRLVARISNHYVLAQVIRAGIKGDEVVASASSRELPRYGMSVGLKNYAAAYCTGLLVARRVLTKFGLADAYAGNEEITGDIVTCEDEDEMTGRKRTYFVSEVDGERKPFRAALDVGIHATTTGAKVFGVLKGASDGGMDIPHSNKRFPGYIKEAKKFDVENHKNFILGQPIIDYMNELKEDDPESFEKRFSKFAALDIEPDELTEMYEKTHEAIRKDPSYSAKKAYKSPAKFNRTPRSTYEERKAKLAKRKVDRAASLASKAAGAVEEDD